VAAEFSPVLASSAAGLIAPGAEFLPLTALFTVGVIAGALNVVAGGGSFLTLPVLLFLGLPAAEANGTNRLGILTQNLMGVWGFHRAQALDWRWAGAVSVPALAGAALGAWLALEISDFAFRRLLSVAMLGMTLWTLLGRPRADGDGPTLSPWHPGLVVAFLLIGLYGGFIQAGVGFAILAATHLAGIDLVRGNAVKVFTVLLLTALSLAVFAAGGAIRWAPGLSLAAGNALGALAGVRVAVRLGQVWTQRVVTVAVVALAVLLWVSD
jgi:uncharacterized membrane protein YfcA